MDADRTLLAKLIRFCLENKLIVLLFTVFVIIWGVVVAPFNWELSYLPRDPVPVDAIPDIGENQQIVFTSWAGRSPQDVEDQISYPLTVSLLGIPGVRTIRSNSYFGFSSVNIIFKEGVDFYWSRSRILEKLSSLPQGTLPQDVSPVLGPDATALGQVFWYTIEGRAQNGKPVGGWDLDELRTVQDWTVRYALQSVDGVAEVASIGGFVREYQVDVDPNAMRAYGVSLSDVIAAVKNSNIDVGARTIEVNSVEYVVRGLGFIKTVEDLRDTVVRTDAERQVPIYLNNIAKVTLGPALRRGALDKGGAEAVGGVVVVRYGENPLAVINRIKDKIEEISPGLGQKTLPDGTVSKLVIVPFYDRSDLIYETLGTLSSALKEEILITIMVVVVMVVHLGSSFLISGLLPLAVLICFILMKHFRVDANIVALSGIAIAIGTMVDMGIVLCENILVHLSRRPAQQSRLDAVYEASVEVAGAVVTAVSTTIVSFLPVFAMEAAEGKLFKPLAFTKTFALVAALLVSITIIPPAAHAIFTDKKLSYQWARVVHIFEITVGILLFTKLVILGSALIILGLFGLFETRLTSWLKLFPISDGHHRKIFIISLVLCTVLYYLTSSWMPFGFESGLFANLVFAALLIFGVFYLFQAFMEAYPAILSWCLEHKMLFLSAPAALLIIGGAIWLRMGKEFMPALDEGSFLYMPTTMPHASIGETLDQLKKLDMAISQIPEVDMTVGKLGRAESPLDPAPISMFENIINYKSEYKTDEDGHPVKFKYDREKKEFVRDATGELIPDFWGKPYRQWRDHIRSPDDIWKEIVDVAQIPGVTSAPKLQPIAARLVMLQSGMRAPMGVKVKGPSLEAIEETGEQIEKYLKEVPSIEASTVIADRLVGKPYLEIDINRKEIARYGLSIRAVQEIIEVAIGGKPLSMTVEGRERYAIRIRYPRELRNDIEGLQKILIPTATKQQIPLMELAKIRFSRRAQAIKGEDTFLVGYVLFDKKKGQAEVNVVEDAQNYLKSKIDAGEFRLQSGVSYVFAGSYENQVRSEKRLYLVLPLALFVIFIILYLQFRSSVTAFIIFLGILVAWSGGFLMLWLYSQEWFLNITFFEVNLRELFQMRSYNLSVAIWVGFIALFGIATDDGVLISTYIKQTIDRLKPQTRSEVRAAILEAGKRRIRPAVMTTATTLLALLPVLTSTGRGADIMIPMAIPSFGGMAVAMLTYFIVPVLQCAVEERRIAGKRLPPSSES